MKKKTVYETPDVNLILIPLGSAICETSYGATNEEFEGYTFEF